MNDTNQENAQLSGKWTINAEAMGQALQISLDLEQNGNEVTGKMESALGGGKLNGTVTGNSFSAVSKTEKWASPSNLPSAARSRAIP